VIFGKHRSGIRDRLARTCVASTRLLVVVHHHHHPMTL